MKNFKKWLSAGARILAFLIPAAMLFNYLQFTLIHKEDNWALAQIENQPDGSYDVLLVGSSHMRFAIQPAQLFGEYGIAACNLATPAQPIPGSYHLMKEMIQRHKPKLVVLDLLTINQETITSAPVRLHQVLDYFPLSLNKIQAIEDLVEENKAEFYFPIILYHNRWTELSRSDYMPYSSGFNETYNFLDGCHPFTEPFTPVEESYTYPIPEIPLRYLEQIVQLCKETDTPLLLTLAPYWADPAAPEIQGMVHTAGQLARQWGVDYLNALFEVEEMGFDFTTDMTDIAHINPIGSEKVTAYYGQYFRDHYDLPDRSQDPAYSHWYDDYAEYLEALTQRKAG